MDAGPRKQGDADLLTAPSVHREGDLSALMELTQSLASRDDIFDILFSVVSRLADLLDIDRGSIVLREAGGDEGIIVATSDDAAMRNHRIVLDKYPELRRTFDTAQLLVIRDVTESSLMTEVLAAEGGFAFSSMALIPIIGHEETLAALCLKSRAQTDFSEYDLMHAQAVANATAIALNNARTLGALRDETRALFSAHRRDKKRLEELSRYLDLFESARDAMVVTDRAGEILFANPMAAQLTHRPAHGLLGTSVQSLFSDEDAAGIQEILAGWKRGAFPGGVDLVVRPPAPRTIVSVNFSCVLGEGETVLATMRDVTSERGLARELAQTKDFLERVIESSVDGIVSADLRGNVLVFNRAAEALFGYSKLEVFSGVTVDKLYPEGVARDIMRRIRRKEHGGAGVLEDYRVEMLTHQGERVPVKLSASLVLDGDRPVGTVGIFTDIRTQLAMEAQLSEAQEQLADRRRNDAIAEVAGAAAHELNQPLTSVMGYTEYLRRGVKDDPALSHAVDVITAETQRMADIVRKVGRITRYETKPYVGAANIIDLDRSSTPEG